MSETRTPKVLVVDDEPDIRSLCGRFLRKEGWSVDEAPDGRAAIERMNSNPFDIVVTDLVMDGDIDGAELARRARSHEHRPSVILMTAYPCLDTALQAIREGASDYIVKPFSGEALLDSIRRCWEPRRLHEELTSVKALQRELAAAYEELKRLERMKTDFTSRVGHELRSPLTTMISAIDLLGHDEAISEDSRRLLEILKRGAANMKGSVENLLNFSDLENGRMRCRLRETDLSETINGLLKEFEPLWKERRLQIRMFAPERETRAWADPEVLLLALRHLVANAILHNVTDGHIEIRLSRTEQENVLQITSTGREVPKEEIPKLFDTFYQVGECITREVGGLGLGLAIVRRAVTLHGGSVTATVLTDGRFRFLISLPRPTVYE